jgi:hypothetical protein
MPPESGPQARLPLTCSLAGELKPALIRLRGLLRFENRTRHHVSAQNDNQLVTALEIRRRQRGFAVANLDTVLETKNQRFLRISTFHYHPVRSGHNGKEGSRYYDLVGSHDFVMFLQPRESLSIALLGKNETNSGHDQGCY